MRKHRDRSTKIKENSKIKGTQARNGLAWQFLALNALTVEICVGAKLAAERALRTFVVSVSVSFGCCCAAATVIIAAAPQSATTISNSNPPCCPSSTPLPSISLQATLRCKVASLACITPTKGRLPEHLVLLHTARFRSHHHTASPFRSSTRLLKYFHGTKSSFASFGTLTPSLANTHGSNPPAYKHTGESLTSCLQLGQSSFRSTNTSADLACWTFFSRNRILP